MMISSDYNGDNGYWRDGQRCLGVVDDGYNRHQQGEMVVKVMVNLVIQIVVGVVINGGDCSGGR